MNIEQRELLFSHILNDKKQLTKQEKRFLDLLTNKEVTIILSSVNPTLAFDIYNKIIGLDYEMALKSIEKLKDETQMVAYKTIVTDEKLYQTNYNYYKYATKKILEYDKPNLYIQFSCLLTNDFLYSSEYYVQLVDNLSKLEGNENKINNIYRIIQDIIGQIYLNNLEKEYLKFTMEMIINLSQSNDVYKLEGLIEQLQYEIKKRIEILKDNSLTDLETKIKLLKNKINVMQ